jgi:molybdopterin/thiamine biosynthesis adenylyltransferase
MRHGRQMRLAGVGETGQKRLASASLAVCAEGTVGDVATRYLAGAGVGRLRVKNASLATTAHAVDPTVQVEVDSLLELSDASAPFVWRDPAAAELAAGAHLALDLLRKALRESP